MKDRLIYLLPLTLATGMAILFYRWTAPPARPSAHIQEFEKTSVSAASSAEIRPHSKPGSAASLPTRQAIEPSAQTLIQQAKKALQSGEHDPFLKFLIELVRIDPLAAVALAQSAGPLREEAMQRVIQHWADHDSQAAEAWAASLPDAQERTTAITAVCYEVAANDPESAIEIARQHGIGHENVMFQDLAEQWAAKDFPAARDWASSQPPSENRNQIFARLAMVQAKSEPEDAVQLVLTQIPQGPSQSEAAISVLYQWATRDQAGAAAWVAQFPPGALRERAERELAGIAAQQSGQSP